MKEWAEVGVEDEAVKRGSIQDPALHKGAIRWLRRETLGNLVLIAILFVTEDKALNAELPGYREYTERVRYRLLPGVW